MKSRVISYPNPEGIRLRPDQLEVERADSAKETEYEMDLIRRKYSEVEQRKTGERVENGDALKIDTSCDKVGAPGKFNREDIGISLGKGFFDAAIEKSLEGCGVGETVSARGGKNAEWPVDVVIRSASHTAIRSLTEEECLKESSIYGVEARTEEDLFQLIKSAIVDAENIDHFLMNIQDDLADQLVEGGVFEIDEEELEDEKRRWHREVEGLPDYAESEDDIGFIEYVQDIAGTDSESREELEKALDEHYDKAFRYNLILLDLARDEPDPSPESLKEAIDSLVAQGYSDEELEEVNDYRTYVKDHKLEVGQYMLRKIIEKQLRN